VKEAELGCREKNGHPTWQILFLSREERGKHPSPDASWIKEEAKRRDRLRGPGAGTPANFRGEGGELISNELSTKNRDEREDTRGEEFKGGVDQ